MANANNVDQTYDALVGDLGLEAKSLARHWLRDMPDPNLERPSEFDQAFCPRSGVSTIIRGAEPERMKKQQHLFIK